MEGVEQGAPGREPAVVFLSYARADRERVLPLAESLHAAGVPVFVDEHRIDEFEGITEKIRQALAGARLFVAYYSATYPSRPACQWELLTAFRVASALGPPGKRILVVNPEQSTAHIQPVELADPRYLEPGDHAADRLVERLSARLAGGPEPFGDAVQSVRPVWRPTEHLGSERFVGRVAEFWQLHTALHAHEYPATQDDAATGQAAVIGLGGVGKTLLAEHYARRFASFYPGGVYWFTAAASHAPETAEEGAGNRGRPLTDTVALHAEVRAQHYQQVAAALALDPARNSPEEIREAARRHIERIGAPCLWIVDDLPGHLTPAVLRELAAPHPLGRTLVTTRWRGYQLPRIDVDVLAPEEAYRLLTGTREPAGPVEEDSARTLVARLGCHALAIDLVRGCLEDQRDLTYSALLRELDDTQHGDGFQDLLDDLYLQVPTDHTADIAATFTRSLRHLDEDALTLLRAAANLAAAPIPTRLLTAVTATVRGIDESAAERANLRALSTAQRRSLIRQTGDEAGGWFLHALVSRTLTLDPAQQEDLPALRAAVTAAATRLMQPVYQAGRLDLADLTPHVRALTETLDTPPSLELLASLARYDLETGHPARAATHYERLAQAREARLGRHHPTTLTSLHNFALACRTAGDFDRAIPLLLESLADRTRVLGTDHSDTLVARNSLAYAYVEVGDLDRAIPLLLEGLADSERLLGHEHPRTLTSRNNLAVAYEEARDFGRAIPLHIMTLEGRERVLGADHPDTLSSRNNLAVLFKETGNFDAAIALFKEILVSLERVLGSDHPDTLLCRNNLAAAHRGAGDLDRAISLYEQTLTDRERVLEPGHPSILRSRNNLAAAYQSAGDFDRAVPLLVAALADRERLIGSDHPDTLMTRHNLAATYEAAGDLRRAALLYEQTLAGRERVLGAEHPRTLNTRAGLERVRRAATRVSHDAEGTA